MSNNFPLTSFTQDIDFFIHLKKQNCHGQPAIEIYNADEKIHTFLKSVVCNNWITSDDYIAKQGVMPFVQGGYTEKKGWIMIEFWCRDAQKISNYIEHLNARAKTFEFWE